LHIIDKAKKKILFILDSPYPPVTGLNRTLINRAEFLRDNLKDIEIHIVSRGIEYSTFKYDGFIVHRIGFGKKMGIERFDSNWERVKFAFKSFVYITLRLKDVDLVSSMHFVANFTSFLFHLVSRKKYICEMVELAFDTDQAWGRGRGVLYRIPNKLLEYLECKVIPKWAERVIVMTDAFKRTMTERYGIKKQKILVMSEGIDPRILCWAKIKEKKKLAELQQKYALKNKTVIMTTGFFDSFVDRVDLLFKAFKELKSRHSDLKLVFAGDGDKQFRAMIDNIVDDDIILTGWQERRRDAYHILHLADICVLPMEKRLGHDVIYCSKLMDYIAFRKPIVLFNLEAMGQLVEKHGVGKVANKVSELANALEDVLKNLDDFSATKFDVLINEFKLENVNKNYPRLIEGLLYSRERNLKTIS
jgi:glycosyltransferase involved in cell wall biosynthesis